jgi:hypothetical protein
MHRTLGADRSWGDRQECLKGASADALQQLDSWLEDVRGQHIFWLNGPAGTGKSATAQMFTEIAFAEGKLGASFFCSRDFEDRSNLQLIFPTLAFQLAHRYPLFREQLLEVLKADPGIGRQSLCSQLEKVIVGPFKATRISTLIIIDALDECKDEEPTSSILSMLSRYVDEIPNIKFFITGRPEPQIRSGFHLEALCSITTVLKLHDEKKSTWKSTASATAKLLLRGVRDSSDAFGPLKSVASGLCFILENCEVWPSSHRHYPQCLHML